MNYTSLLQVALATPPTPPGGGVGSPHNKKLQLQLHNHKKDLEDVLQKIRAIAMLNIQGLNDLRSFISVKQGNLTRRTLIPKDIREEGMKVYATVLREIDKRLG